MPKVLSVANTASTPETSLAHAAQAYVVQLFENSALSQNPFHDLRRVVEVVKDATLIAKSAKLSREETEVVVLASWFLLTGFSVGHPAVREKSLAIAKQFLTDRGCEAKKIQQVLDCIRSAQDPSGPHKQPTLITEEVVSDASTAYLAKKKFWRRTDFLRLEIESIQGNAFTDLDWLALLADRFGTSRIHTLAGQDLFGEQRAKNLKEVSREIKKHGEYLQEEEAASGKADSKGIETLFRTQSRTLTNLVATADRKAHLMITVNAITISILMRAITDQIQSNPRLAIPLGILITVNLATIIISILVVRPRTPEESKVTHDDVVLKHGSLMTQVIFAEISYEDFRHGVRRMMKDENHLYDTLIQSLYGTARVLKRKFKMLQWAYSIFVYGMVVAALSYGYVIVTSH